MLEVIIYHGSQLYQNSLVIEVRALPFAARQYIHIYRVIRFHNNPRWRPMRMYPLFMALRPDRSVFVGASLGDRTLPQRVDVMYSVATLSIGIYVCTWN